MGRTSVVALRRVIAPRQGYLGRRFLNRNVLVCVVIEGIRVQEGVIKGIDWIGWPVRLDSRCWLPNRWHRCAAAMA